MLMVLLVLISLVLLFVLGVSLFFFFQLRKNKRLQAERARAANEAAWGVCAKCQQRRLIVNKDAGLCAFCWSSMHTKPLV
jgi:ubiquitin